MKQPDILMSKRMSQKEKNEREKTAVTHSFTPTVEQWEFHYNKTKSTSSLSLRPQGKKHCPHEQRSTSMTTQTHIIP